MKVARAGWDDVVLVARREVHERFRGRIFQVGTAIILLVVAAAIVIPVLTRTKAHPQRVGVVGAVSAPLRAALVAAATGLGTSVDLVSEPSLPAADAGLRTDRVDLAVVDGAQIVVKRAITSADTSVTAQFVRAAARALGAERAYAAAGLSASQSSILASATPLPVIGLQATTPARAAHPASIVALILVFVMLSQYTTWILTGVVEEKASRVVEVLLATVRPSQLLTGKVLGIGLVACTQAAVIVTFALGLASAVGSDLLRGTAPLTLASTLLWLVLGYAFYCWVYAAAGSTAERQEQLQALAFPLGLPLILGYVVSLTAAASGTASTFVRVLAYLPPTAPFAMPVLVGIGTATWWQFAISVALSLACTVAVARLATAVYRRAILRTGRRVRLRDVISAGKTETARPAGASR